MRIADLEHSPILDRLVHEVKPGNGDLAILILGDSFQGYYFGIRASVTFVPFSQQGFDFYLI